MLAGVIEKRYIKVKAKKQQVFLLKKAEDRTNSGG